MIDGIAHVIRDAVGIDPFLQPEYQALPVIHLTLTQPDGILDLF